MDSTVIGLCGADILMDWIRPAIDWKETSFHFLCVFNIDKKSRLSELFGTKYTLHRVLCTCSE